MKKLVKRLAALIVCGSFVVFNCENVEASEMADLTTSTVETQEMAKPHFPPSPPPHPHHHHRRHRHRHHDDWRDPPPPPPPPPGHHHRPPRHW